MGVGIVGVLLQRSSRSATAFGACRSGAAPAPRAARTANRPGCRRARRARELERRRVFLRRQVRLNQVSRRRHVLGRKLVGFLERCDRLVELAELLVGEAEMRKQETERTLVLRRDRKFATAGASASTTAWYARPLLERLGERVVTPRALAVLRDERRAVASAAVEVAGRRSACESRYSARVRSARRQHLLERRRAPFRIPDRRRS